MANPFPTTVLIPAGVLVLTEQDGMVRLDREVETVARRQADGSWLCLFGDQLAECAGGLASVVA